MLSCMKSERDYSITTIQNAYQQSAESGKIDPHKMDIESFALRFFPPNDFLDLPCLPTGHEIMNSRQEVANLMKGGEQRTQVIEQWFGRGKER